MTVAYCIDPQMVGRVWFRVRGMIAAALARGTGETSIEEIEQDLTVGLALLWIGFDQENNQIVSAGITQIGDGLCTLVAYGGRREDHLLETIEDYARANGCERLRILGRKGWIRVLKNYHQPYVVLERQL